MMDTIGFLGCGNMGGAIARAVCKAVDPKKVFLANRTAAKAQALAKELGCKTATNAEVAGDCDLIFLAVKPQMMEALLQPLKFTFDERPSRFVLCSMAAGLSIARIQEMAGEDFPVIRIMPNTPASVGEGMIQYCSSNVTAEEEEAFLRIWLMAGWPAACPAPKRRNMPRRWFWAAQSWCWKAESIPANSRMLCAAPAAAPFRACACWKSTACAVR